MQSSFSVKKGHIFPTQLVLMKRLSPHCPVALRSCRMLSACLLATELRRIFLWSKGESSTHCKEGQEYRRSVKYSGIGKLKSALGELLSILSTELTIGLLALLQA